MNWIVQAICAVALFFIGLFMHLHGYRDAGVDRIEFIITGMLLAGLGMFSFIDAVDFTP